MIHSQILTIESKGANDDWPRDVLLYYLAKLMVKIYLQYLEYPNRNIEAKNQEVNE